MKRWFKILYLKWVKGVCHQTCAFCSYQNDCFDNLEYEYDNKKYHTNYSPIKGQRWGLKRKEVD